MMPRMIIPVIVMTFIELEQRCLSERTDEILSLIFTRTKTLPLRMHLKADVRRLEELQRNCSPTPRALIPMATTKHIVIQTAGLVVLSQKLMMAAAADNSATRQSISREFYILSYKPGKVSYVVAVSEVLNPTLSCSHRPSIPIVPASCECIRWVNESLGEFDESAREG